MSYTVVINDYKVLADSPQEVVALVSWTEKLVHPEPKEEPEEEPKTVERKPPADKDSSYVPHGITNTQYSTWKAIQEFGSINALQLAELLDLPKSTVSTRIQDLHAKGHLVRVSRGIYRARV